ncbi:YbhB/YbcL family Raf kinase inhibitor-like protein [Amycolatopsis sp. NBC_00345]|uniref:YbhB/YbcL family Raf kinase inhibitor-like protein n=1 Tax=Amycolatopsis sp. NBC_00345 TaxID=2975955 RepID=UPI002E274EFA
MKRTLLTIAAVAITLGASLGVASASSRPAAHVDQLSWWGPNPYEYLPKVPSFGLTSQTVRNHRPLPTPQLSGIFGAPGGKDISPQLSWSGFPARTKSFVVSMYDPQAPTGSGFWHWVVADIPATTTSLPENAGAHDSTTLPTGAFQLAGDAGAFRYIGGAPPKGSGTHNYYLTVTALDIATSGTGPTTSGALLGFTIGSHTIARATLVCPTAAE